MIFGIEFPPVSHVIEWPEIWLEGTPFAISKVVILMWLSAAIAFAVIWMGARRFSLVPRGVQNVAESAVDFIQDGVILQTIGPEGLHWTLFLMSMFLFIFIGNIWEIVWLAQMPVNARIAFPALMAILVWFIFNFIGIKHQGFFGYFKSMLFPPGVPKALYILVTPIEFVSTIFVRPLSLAVRLFANMLAGHLLLVSFITITAAVFEPSGLAVIWPFSLGLLIGLTAFEVLVSVLQAFIFTILTAVYIGGAMHPEH